MTHTQANEPGFVLAFAAVADTVTEEGGWKETDVLELIAEGGDREFVGSITVGDVRRAALAAAPLVPSPAYGGVKALEWLRVPLTDFSSRADTAIGSYSVWTHHEADGMWFGRLDDGIRREASGYASENEAKAAAQADFERRVLSCLSPVAVEEADAKSGESQQRRHADNCPWDKPRRQLARRCTCGAADATPSTPSPQIGKAGAGLVGDATDVMIEAGLKVDMTNEDEVAFLHNVWHAMAAVHPAGAGPVGEAVAFIDPADLTAFADLKRRGYRGAAMVRSEPGYAKTAPLYVHPVEEPGEVERLTRERDEVRERLEKLVASSSKARTALAGFTSADDAAFALDVAIGDVADWKRRAALTGDAQEAGR